MKNLTKIEQNRHAYAPRGLGWAMLVCALGSVSALAAEPTAPSRHTTTMELEWVETPVGALASPVWGDFQRGEHGTYLRFPPGAIVRAHTHSGDYHGVVVSGNMRHWIPGQPDTRVQLPPGSHWYMPGHVTHVSECLPGVECVALIVQKDKFDLFPAQSQ